MRDPWEGRAADGSVRTGVRAERITAAFRPVLDRAVDRVASAGASLYVYGSVATGRARPGSSDVDLLTVDLAPDDAAALSAELSAAFSDRCRAVEVGVTAGPDLVGDGDRAYGGRAFLHHYCVHLTGPDHDRATTPFPADRRLACAFNGDVAHHAAAWRDELARSRPTDLARRVGRKTLLAVAGLVSVHDDTWTTDRDGAAARWREIDPASAAGVDTLLAWSAATGPIEAAELVDVLPVVDGIVDRFATDIGLWPDPVPHRRPADGEPVGQPLRRGR